MDNLTELPEDWRSSFAARSYTQSSWKSRSKAVAAHHPKARPGLLPCLIDPCPPPGEARPATIWHFLPLQLEAGSASSEPERNSCIT